MKKYWYWTNIWWIL